MHKAALCSHWISYCNSTAFAFNCSRTAHCTIALVSEWPLIVNNWDKLKNVPTEPSNWLLYGFWFKLLNALPTQDRRLRFVRMAFVLQTTSQMDSTPDTYAKRVMGLLYQAAQYLKYHLDHLGPTCHVLILKEENAQKKTNMAAVGWLCVISAHGSIVPRHVKGQVNQKLAWGDQ